ncbi:FtsB family cell division protein [Roseospira goensis]|uniref:Cell division protein FtsB n=1 Tax=Roseospira goensis TaxID=391922 RepID=A0A7W6WKF3_9PROT|nr:septum formation initiator family protein [Roseospira goensis]MBB4286050.1 cell division protein FtsB [Roseospira goensis]
MASLPALRRRFGPVLPPVLGLGALVYFGYHAVNGDRGLLAWWQLRQDIRVATQERAALAEERRLLEHRVRLLRRDQLHPDMLDERARAMLNLVGPDEIVIVPPRPASGRDPGAFSTD